VARDHGFHPARITRVVEETADTQTFVLDLPPTSPSPFTYRAGQFLTFRLCGTLRSYSMSSAPEVDASLMVTVKRVPGGLVSGWMHEHLAPGDVVEVTRPAGVFCLRETAAPMVAFGAGSGITPILSLVKSALAVTGRRVRVLTANRDAGSVIFAAALGDLAGRYPDRLEVRHHLDEGNGFVTGSQVRSFAGGDLDADFYICGPAPFMDLTERALLDGGVAAEQIFIERFEVAPGSEAPSGPEREGPEREGTVCVVLSGRRHTVPQHAGETLLESARRAGLSPPFSCEAGNCATCIAQVTEGEAKMRANNALDDDEIADGWVLTCQGEPVTPHVTVVYED
jgi:ferredoxin-NADP reductase